ncbi:MAG: glycoside hydrolase family 15 protein, partial [Pseudomonadota bacterium]
MTYQPIENYGMIGDLRTVALVSTTGSIDWLCLPRFDSPAVFGAILDDQKGGSCRIWPDNEEDTTFRQSYWPDSNVLVTRFFTDSGAIEMIDFMPIHHEQQALGDCRQLIRLLTATRGTMELRLHCQPAFNFARDSYDAHEADGGVIFCSPNLTLGLSSSVPLEVAEGIVSARFTLTEGDTAAFVIHELPDADAPLDTPDVAAANAQFRATVDYWRRWLAQSQYRGRWREMVNRSALALKLMTYAPTGAIVAAPTCSLPEGIGGSRNWDYRYTWIRDSAFTLYAFMRLGFTSEAGRYMRFVARLCDQTGKPDGPLQIMYGIDGRSELTEETLEHLDGYRGSKPVRVGNGAYNQLQLDIYGELMDAAYLYNKYGAPISHGLWLNLRSIVDWVCDNWRRQDEGIWEVRSGRQQFTYSKLMCWVAIDRGLKLANDRALPCDRLRWRECRDRIYEDIMQHGWNEDVQSFVQYYGGQTLDASLLTMPLVLFLSPTDPKLLTSLKAMMKPPKEGGLLANHLVYRYNLEHSEDGLDGEEGTFNICTFWLVDALTRVGRYHPEYLETARLIFERMLSFANHVGLYAEETGPRGEALGNYP